LIEQLPPGYICIPDCAYQPTEKVVPAIFGGDLALNKDHDNFNYYASQLRYGGCGFIPWSVLQGEGQVCLFIKHWRTHTIVSRTLRIALAWSQKQTGFSLPILQYPQSAAPHLEARWIRSLREALLNVQGSIIVDRPYTIAPERTNDRHIMDWIIESKKFYDKDIRILNYCRLYLNVTTISELFDATGKYMLPLMYQCQRPNWFNRHQFIILQRRPSQYQIDRKWKAFCHYWCEPKTLKRHESINLGEWHPTQKYRPWRQSYVDTSSPNQTIYHYHDQHYWTLTQIPNCYGNYTLHEPTPWTPTLHAMPIQLRTGQSTNLEYTRNYDDNHNVPTVFARNVSNYTRTQTDP
jgi:hypothetical protein